MRINILDINGGLSLVGLEHQIVILIDAGSNPVIHPLR